MADARKQQQLATATAEGAMSLILIVEDDEKIAANMTLRLARGGIRRPGIPLAEDALAVFLRRRRACSPTWRSSTWPARMSGIDLVRILGDAMPPAIVISGEASRAKPSKRSASACKDFIETPFSRERLISPCATAYETRRCGVRSGTLRSRDQQIVGASEAVLVVAGGDRESARPMRAC